MTCAVKNYIGQGECHELRESIVGAFLYDKGTTITKASIATTAGIQAVTSPATVATIAGVVLNFGDGAEPTGGENELTTSNMNSTVLTNRSEIILDGYAKMSYKDYQAYYSFEGKPMKIGLIDKNGDITGTNANATNFTGYRCRLYLDKMLPKVGADRQKDYHFHIIFDDINEFGAKDETITTDYSAIEVFEDVNPIGLDLSIVTAYAIGGTVTVKATLRNSLTPYAALTTASEWEVISATADIGVTIAVTSFANAALGEYTLTIKNGTPADLVGTAYIQGLKVAASIMTHTTNQLAISL